MHDPSRTRLTACLRRAALPAVVALLLGPAGNAATPGTGTASTGQSQCLPGGQGFFKARLQGSLDAELDWGNEATECSGAVRPDGGVRLGFSRPIFADGERLVLLFGIAGLREGVAARALPVNLTIIRQGTGQFFGTQGDDKCLLDDVRQEPLAGIPLRHRTYRITARGFCTQPARSLKGDGAVLVTRFDFVGRVDFAEADTAADPSPSAAGLR